MSSDEFLALLRGRFGDAASVADVVRYTLTDLRHLCEAHDLDFAKLDRKAYLDYLEER